MLGLLTNGDHLAGIIEQKSKGVVTGRGNAEDTALGLQTETLAEKSGILPNLGVSDLGKVDGGLDGGILAGLDSLATQRLVVELDERREDTDVKREGSLACCCCCCC